MFDLNHNHWTDLDSVNIVTSFFKNRAKLGMISCCVTTLSTEAKQACLNILKLERERDLTSFDLSFTMFFFRFWDRTYL